MSTDDFFRARLDGTDQGQAYYEERYLQRVLYNLNRRAQQLGMTWVPAQGAPAA